MKNEKLIVYLSITFIALVTLSGNLKGRNEIKNENIEHIDSNVIVKNDSIGEVNKLSEFVLPNYLILDSISGNLNRDKYMDMILILKEENEEQIANRSDTMPLRPLLILLGNANGTYRQACRNDNVIYCVNCGGAVGDPYLSTQINNGTFIITHYGGSFFRWEDVISFTYSAANKKWFLSKQLVNSFASDQPDKIDTRILLQKKSKKIPFSEFGN